MTGMILQLAGFLLIGPSALTGALLSRTPTMSLVCIALVLIGLGDALAMAPMMADMLYALRAPHRRTRDEEREVPPCRLAGRPIARR
jgi:hypothetical protein